jgi:DNA-binding transcriptional ArsR family regulator
MIHPPQDSASPALDSRRLTARQSAEYFLNIVRLLDRAVDRDLVTTLTFLSIARANMRHFTNSSAMAMRYAAMDAIPPDSERAPVTVYAVAKELGIPYETVRRHAAKLRKEGMCQAVSGGLIIPNSAFFNVAMLEAVSAHWALTQDLVNSAGGYATVASDPPPGDVSRQVVRLGVDYFLDVIALIGRTLEVDALAALVMRAVSFVNLEQHAYDPQAYPDVPIGPGDSDREPVSVYAVAKTLNLPYETTRRHVRRLMERGLLEKSGAGVIVPERVSARPQVLAGIGELTARTETYLARLAELGVVPGGAPVTR